MSWHRLSDEEYGDVWGVLARPRPEADDDPDERAEFYERQQLAGGRLYDHGLAADSRDDRVWGMAFVDEAYWELRLIRRNQP